MANVAGRERGQLGTTMSAGLKWFLIAMPLPFSLEGKGMPYSNVVSELVVSGLFLVLNYTGIVVLNMHNNRP